MAEDNFRFYQMVKAAFPELPRGLVRAFADGWAEGGSAEAGLVAMRADPLYDQVFPGNRLEQGGFVLSERDYLVYRERATTLLRRYGIPPTYFDTPEDIGQLVGNRVSLQELEARVRQNYVAALQAPREVRDELARDYGVGIGDLAGFWLDPDRGVEVLQRKFTEAEIRAQALITQYGSVTLPESARLAELGVTGNEAREGFAGLAANRALFDALVGSLETDVTREEQLGAAFGFDQEASRRIQRQRSNRQAVFEGGGGAAQTSEGIVGLGKRTQS